jgi:hypothetical protein
MSKRRKSNRLLAQVQEENNKDNGLIITSKEGDNNNLSIDREIECPRSHDIMTLCSDFYKLLYTCEECSFLLVLN